MDRAARLAALKTEFETDPTERGYAPHLASGADNQLADLINARTLAARRWVPTDVLRAHLFTAGIWPRLWAVIYTEAAPAELKAACRFVIDATDPKGLLALDLDLPACVLLFGTFQAPEVNLLSAPESAALLALADTLVSRAEVVLEEVGTAVQVDEIAQALRGNSDGE
jgi:hypothetical protein